VREELNAYGEGLADKREILALNKVDALTPELRKERLKALKKAAGVTPMQVSGVSGEGVSEVLRAALKQIRAGRVQEAEDNNTPDPEAWRP
jgi:GTP-binding protein